MSAGRGRASVKGKERDMGSQKSIVSFDSPKPRSASLLAEKLVALKNAIGPSEEVRFHSTSCLEY